MQLTVGLTLALISAVAVNWAYSREHDAAAVMPHFSPRRPLRFVSLLLGERRWLTGFWRVPSAATSTLRRCVLPAPAAGARQHTAELSGELVNGRLAEIVPSESLT